MTAQARLVRGSVKIILCESCKMDFPIFDFEAESDNESIGLCSAGICGGNKLLLIDLNLEEWKAFEAGNLRELPSRLSLLADQAYRLAHVLRIEQPFLPPAGISFMEFRQQYRAPTVIYSCPCCGKGEAVMRSEITPAEYASTGGRIIAMEPLALVS